MDNLTKEEAWSAMIKTRRVLMVSIWVTIFASSRAGLTYCKLVLIAALIVWFVLLAFRVGSLMVEYVFLEEINKPKSHE